MFRVGHATVNQIVRETCQAIWSVLRGEVLPELNEYDWLDIADTFSTKWNVPHCLGAIDGKHVVIEVSGYNKQADIIVYTNRI
jgi:hypothetical protein